MQLTKKDAIRKYILSMHDDSKFNLDSLAGWVNTEQRRKDITAKDVSNTVGVLVTNGVLTKSAGNGSKADVYAVNSNNAALWFAKHPIPNDDGVKATAATTLRHLNDIPTIRRKARSPFVISIDKEIKILEDKMKRLHAIRKEFA